MKQSIETILGLNINEIKRRIKEEKNKIRTFPGTGYLKERLKRYQTPEWEFLSYLAHWCPEELSECFDSYNSYAGAEGREAILEGLREDHILSTILIELEEKNKS